MPYYKTVYQWNSCEPFLSKPWEHGQLEDKLQDNYALGSHKEGAGESEERDFEWMVQRTQTAMWL